MEKKPDKNEKIDYKAFGLPPNDLHQLPGEKKLVPVGGQNIPKSMPTMFDEAYIKQSQNQQKIVYGEEYDQLLVIRKELMRFKKILGQICPPHEAMLRHKAVFK